MVGEPDRKVDIVGRTSDGKPFIRKGLFTVEELSQYLSTMITVFGPDATIGALVHFKARQQE